MGGQPESARAEARGSSEGAVGMIEPTKIYKTGLVVAGAVTAAGLALGFSAHAKADITPNHDSMITTNAPAKTFYWAGQMVRSSTIFRIGMEFRVNRLCRS
jgi:hypothetical protein